MAILEIFVSPADAAGLMSPGRTKHNYGLQ
jgi:hypothetical protein